MNPNSISWYKHGLESFLNPSQSQETVVLQFNWIAEQHETIKSYLHERYGYRRYLSYSKYYWN